MANGGLDPLTVFAFFNGSFSRLPKCFGLDVNSPLRKSPGFELLSVYNGVMYVPS